MLPSDATAKSQLESVLMYQTPVQMGAAFVSVFIVPLCVSGDDNASDIAMYQRHVFGFIATFNLLFFYSSPLSTMYKVCM